MPEEASPAGMARDHDFVSARPTILCLLMKYSDGDDEVIYRRKGEARRAGDWGRDDYEAPGSGRRP